MLNSLLQSYQLTLAQPYWLWLLLFLPLLFFWRKNQKSNVDSYWKMANLPQQFVQQIPAKVKWYRAIRWVEILSLALLIVAMARPQRTDRPANIYAEGIDIMLSIDISGSMMDKDFEPNRLEAAKKTMSEFVSQRHFDRMGLVIFAGESFTLCPLTLDHSILLQQIGILHSSMLEAGTSIGNGLASAVGSLRHSEVKSKVVVLMTDGVNQQVTGLNIKPEDAIEMAKLYGIKVYAIGIGSNGKALRPTPQPDGTVVDILADVKIDEELLEHVASETGGKYFRATDNTSLKEVYAEIDKLEKSSLEADIQFQYKDVYAWLLVPAAVLLVLAYLLRFVVWRTLTEPKI